MQKEIKSETMPDLTFLENQSGRKLWEKDILGKLEQCLHVFKSNGGEEATEDCFKQFCLDFDYAKYRFKNKLRDINLIMKCRTKADNNSMFGGQQCAEFMSEIQNYCNRYLNATIYTDKPRSISPVGVIRKIRNMAESSESKAWAFENKARETYSSTGKDITLDIIKEIGFDFFEQSQQEQNSR